MDPNSAVGILAIINLLQQLAPEAITLIKALADKLTGLNEAQVADLAHQLNATTIQEVNDELAAIAAEKKAPQSVS